MKYTFLTITILFSLAANAQKGSSDYTVYELKALDDSKCLVWTDNDFEVYNTNSREYKSAISMNSGMRFTSGSYLDADNNVRYVLPKICVYADDASVVRSILEKYKGVLSYENNVGSVYYFPCGVQTANDVLKIVDEVKTIPGVKWCIPNMTVCIQTCNSYYSDQWYLKGSTYYGINVESAWNLVQGSSNTTVAVIDTGVDHDSNMTHEDLANCVLNGYTVDDVNSKGNPKNDSAIYGNQKRHGTHCAGLIAAENNSIGIKGIACGVKILPVNIFPKTDNGFNSGGMADASQIAYAINWASQNADILNCSWVSTTDTNIENAITTALTDGRNGKGCVVVCAAGNYNPHYEPIGFPSTIDNVICVGASRQDGYFWGSSRRGSRIDVVAPGDAIFTLDRMGMGNVNQNYRSDFNGTSAACAEVSGVAALMLSANSNLTSSDVRDILKGTCNNFGITDYITYGCGLADAYAAVCVAKASMTGSTVLCSSNAYSISNLPTGATVSWSLASGNTSCVSLQSNNPSTNQCTLTLTNASGFNSVTLKADVITNGITVKSLQKVISKATPFSGTYEQLSCSDYGFTTPAITTTTIPGSRTMNVYVGGIVTLTSNYFKLKDVHTSGPFGNFHFTGGNQIRFNLVPTNVTQPFVITIEEEGCDDEVKLTFYAIPIQNNYLLNITPISEQAFELRLMRNESEFTDGKVSAEDASWNAATADDELKGKSWTLEVYNSFTIRKATNIELKEPTYLLNTAGWESGIYVVRAIIGGNVLVGKISVP